MEKYAIVVIGYNRVDSIKRLLHSLENVDYAGDQVSLICSIDNSGTHDVEKYVDSYVWKYGRKIVRTFKERQGLRKHVLLCGDLVKDYVAIAVFEDDICAAPGFYRYMKATVEYYQDDDRIAGISLYSHAWNVNAMQAFIPEQSEYDVFFMQFAQSWGQIWTKKQWENFRKWYAEHDAEIQSDDDIPEYVTNWPNTSWLKYYIAYCIKENKYFVYPYLGMSTCFADVGEHERIKNTMYQIPVSSSALIDYKLVKIEDAPVVYDAFFERENVNIAGINSKEICVNLYSTKKRVERFHYVLTMDSLPYKVIRTYGLEYKPHELNVIWDNLGNDIYLYDTTYSASAPAFENVELKQFQYHQRMTIQNKRMVMLLKENFMSKICRFMRRK